MVKKEKFIKKAKVEQSQQKKKPFKLKFNIKPIILKITNLLKSKLAKIICAAVLIALIIGGYFWFFYAPICGTKECFIEKLWECKKADFTNKLENSTWAYSIKGPIADVCEVYAKAISLGSDISMRVLEGKEMICYIPKGTIFMPETKIEYCHGVLKEAIQDKIIEKMHLYIVQNIGKINQSIMQSL